MWLASCDIEFNAANFKVTILLKDPSPELEKWHEQQLLNHLKLHIFCFLINKVVHDSIFVTENHDIFKFIDTRETHHLIKTYYLDEESGLKLVVVYAKEDNLGFDGLPIFTGDSERLGYP